MEERILFNSTISLLVNGSFTFHFKMGKGVRYDDTLVPKLFLIVVEGLAGFTDVG